MAPATMGTMTKAETAARAAAPPAAKAGPPLDLYPPRTRHGLDPRHLGEFARRIEAFRKCYMAQPGYRELGSLQILELGEIRQRFGRRWESVREKAFPIIETCLARRLGPEDLYLVVDEERVWVLAIGARRQEVETRGRLAAAEITERLLGTIPGGVAVRLKTMLFDFAHGLAGVASVVQLEQRIEAFGQAIDAAERKAFLEHAARLQVGFRPTVRLRTGRVVAGQAVALAAGPDGRLVPVASIWPRSINGVLDAELDNWLLARAGEALGRAAAPRAGVILPVHYETLAAPHLREPYLLRLRQLPASAGRRLILELVDLPPGLPQARVRDLTAYVGPLCIGLAARLGHDAGSGEHLEGTGIRGVSLDLATVGSDEVAATTLQRLAGVARKHGMRSLVTGVASARSAERAREVGIDYANGEAIRPAQDVPDRGGRSGRRP